MFGTSGIRGRVGELLVDSVAAGLRELGTDVVDLGVAATPTIARNVGWRDADAGVAVTASHNPPQDNGLKLWQPSGQAYDAAGQKRITERIERSAAELRSWDGLGDRRRVDGKARHVDALVSAAGGAGGLGLDVAVDLGNGAGRVSVDALIEAGCAVETLNAQPDGRFPGRPSEPTAENCAALSTLVAAGGYDLGIAHDGDADRMRAVAGDGTFLSGDSLLALFAADAAGAGDRVAVPVDTSLAVEDFLAERDVSVTRTPVGDVHVAEAATAPDVAFGGEPSGAWIWPAETLCPDGPLAAVRIAAMAASEPLAERLDSIPSYPIRRTSIEVERKRAVMERVESRVLDGYGSVETLDGVRVEADGGWFLIRASGTQPLVRLTAEARSAERADELLSEARRLLEETIGGK